MGASGPIYSYRWQIKEEERQEDGEQEHGGQEHGEQEHGKQKHGEQEHGEQKEEHAEEMEQLLFRTQVLKGEKIDGAFGTGIYFPSRHDTIILPLARKDTRLGAQGQYICLLR